MQTLDPSEARTNPAGGTPIPLLRLPYVVPDILLELTRLRTEILRLEIEVRRLQTTVDDVLTHVEH